MPSGRNAGLMRRATYASVLVALTLIVTKFVVWRLSGSVALLSSLLDSALDLVASLITLVAVRHALTPADREHRFGHGKAEALSALGQSAFVGISAILLTFASVRRILVPRAIEVEELAVGVMALSLVLTVLLVLFQRRVVRETGSFAVSADSLHYLTDILINVGIGAGLVAVWVLGWELLDPLIALSVAAYLAFTAWKIARSSLDMLMDREFSDDMRRRIRDIALSHNDVNSMHDLRTRSSGVHSFIQFHLELDGDILLSQAHAIADEVEALLKEEFPQAEVLIHQDPSGVQEQRPHFA